MERQTWDEYFMNLAKAVSERSTCTRRKVGAVAVDLKHRIIGTGYNGAPANLSHCTSARCVRTLNNIPSGKELDRCRAIHAEANIVLQCGERLNKATLYCTTKPCIACFKLLYGAGVDRIVWVENYDDALSTELMEEGGMIVKRCDFYEWIRM